MDNNPELERFRKMTIGELLDMLDPDEDQGPGRRPRRQLWPQSSMSNTA
jgi:hypothetical protein